MLGGSILLRDWWQSGGTAAQRSCGCPIPGGVQGHVGWGPGQPELVGATSQPTAEGWKWVSFKISSNSSHSAILWFCGFQEKASEFLLPAEPSEVRYFQPFFSCDLCFPGTEANPCIHFINHNYEPVPKGCSPSAQCVSKWKIWSDANLFSLCYTGNKDKRLHLPPL